MKFSFCFVVCLIFSACAGSKVILLERGDSYSIKLKDKISPMMSFSVPEGRWSISAVTLKTMNQGWFDIDGRQPMSPIGYSVSFSIEEIKKSTEYYNELVTALKNNDLMKFSSRPLPWATDKNFTEMAVKNYSQKLFIVNGYKCRNVSYQQKIASQANQGKGINNFILNINCPLIVDGVLYSFVIAATSSVSPKFYEWQAEYNKNKRPEEPEVTIDTDQYLVTMGDKVLTIFNDIRFNGRVSQSYEDIVEK